MKGRDETLRDIQRTTLHSVGPLCELITKIYQGQIISQDQIVEYVSATLVLLGSTTANIVLARRKNAIRAVNSALVNEVESLPHDDQTSLVFGPDNLKTLIDAQKERSTFEKLAAERPAKRQKTNQRPYYNPRENTTYRPNQFFRGGAPPEARASVEPIRGNPAHPTPGDPAGAIPLAITGTRAPKPIKLNVLFALRTTNDRPTASLQAQLDIDISSQQCLRLHGGTHPTSNVRTNPYDKPTLESAQGTHWIHPPRNTQTTVHKCYSAYPRARLHQPGILAEESIWSMETNTKSQAPKTIASLLHTSRWRESTAFSIS